MTKVRSLDKKWKEVVYAMSGLGPNLMMILMGAYFTDAINPTMLFASTADNKELMAIAGGFIHIIPWIFPILWFISKAFDGLIDIPFAKVTDSLNTKWGRRRPPILICFIPMVLSYIGCWIPIGSKIFDISNADQAFNAQLTNTIWITACALIFFSTYTMCLIAFYGSLSQVCDSEGQRLRVSSYKAVFDTIVYALVYALVPVILGGANIHIDTLAIIGSVLMCTMLIPLFMIKEGEKYGYPEKEGFIEEQPTLVQSLKVTFGNKVFLSWLIVNCTAFFGLQMFLTSMNSLIVGGMGFDMMEMAIVETCAFAPVPVMLYLFEKVKRKKGVRFTYQTCLIAFAIAILSFDLASLFVTGGNKPLQLTISIVGGLIGSWGIGAFFMMPLLVPAQVSSVEERLTRQNHSAMYFAAQAVTTSIIGAIASSLVYENIKMFYFNGKTGAFAHVDGYCDNAAHAALASIKFKMPVNVGDWIGIDTDAELILEGTLKNGEVFSLGALLVPIIVCIMCVLGFIACFKMPKDFSADVVAVELKKHNPSLDITPILNEEKPAMAKEKEIPFRNAAFWVLSAGVFGFIWNGFQFKSFKDCKKEALIGGSAILTYLLSALIPFFSIYTILRFYKVIEREAEAKGVKVNNKIIPIIFSILLPLLPLNVVGLTIMQMDMNKVDIV